MSSPQASTVVGSDDEEPAQVPSQQGTQYDDRKFVKELLEACSNKQKKYNFEDYVVEKGRGLEDVHPKTRQKCYVNRDSEDSEVLQGWVGKSRYRGRRTATHNLLVFESMLRGHHAIAADSESVRPGPGAGGGEGDCSDGGGGSGWGPQITRIPFLCSPPDGLGHRNGPLVSTLIPNILFVYVCHYVFKSVISGYRL